jgi:hypothetical protein
VDTMTVTEPSPTPESTAADAAAPVPESGPAPESAPAPEPAPPAEPVERADHPATSVIVGAATAAWDRLGASRNRVGLREVAVGAVFELEDAAAALLARLRGTRSGGGPRPRPVVRLALLLERAQYGVVRLAQRGVIEEDRGRRRAAEAVDSLVDSLATATVVERAIDAQVDRLLRPLVAQILDDVLAQLEGEPERVQALVRGQRDSMVNELVNRLRQSTAAGDTAVDRITARLIRRTPPDDAPAPS